MLGMPNEVLENIVYSAMGNDATITATNLDETFETTNDKRRLRWQQQWSPTSIPVLRLVCKTLRAITNLCITNEARFFIKETRRAPQLIKSGRITGDAQAICMPMPLICGRLAGSIKHLTISLSTMKMGIGMDIIDITGYDNLTELHLLAGDPVNLWARMGRVHLIDPTSDFYDIALRHAQMDDGIMVKLLPWIVVEAARRCLRRDLVIQACFDPADPSRKPRMVFGMMESMARKCIDDLERRTKFIELFTHEVLGVSRDKIAGLKDVTKLHVVYHGEMSKVAEDEVRVPNFQVTTCFANLSRSRSLDTL